jgi:hypothetical protein
MWGMPWCDIYKLQWRNKNNQSQMFVVLYCLLYFQMFTLPNDSFLKKAATCCSITYCKLQHVAVSHTVNYYIVVTDCSYFSIDIFNTTGYMHENTYFWWWLPNIQLPCEVDPIIGKGANSYSTLGTKADKERRKGASCILSLLSSFRFWLCPCLWHQPYSKQLQGKFASLCQLFTLVCTV